MPLRDDRLLVDKRELIGEGMDWGVVTGSGECVEWGGLVRECGGCGRHDVFRVAVLVWEFCVGRPLNSMRCGDCCVNGGELCGKCGEGGS